MFNALRRSLALSASLLIVAAAAGGVLMTLLLADRLANDRLGKEARAIENLAERKTAARFATEVELTRQRLGMLASALEDGLAITVGEPAARNAVSNRRPADIAAAFAPDLRRLGMTAGIVFDHRMEVIGAMNPDADLARIHDAMQGHDLVEALRDLRDSADFRASQGLHRFVLVDPLLARAFQTMPGAPAIMVAMPIFASTGDVIGIVSGLRMMGRNEPILTSLARTLRAGVSLHSEGRLVSSAGDVEGLGPDLPANANGVIRLDRAQRVALCGQAYGIFDICLSRPVGEVREFRDEITAIGIAQSRQASLLLALSGMLGLTVLAIASLHAAHWFTRPLIEIAGSVDRIAAGGWRELVPHGDRSDEIGRIGRAVAAMQTRLEERDRLQAELARIDAINQRRLVMATALLQFEQGISGVMSNLSSTIAAMSSTQGVLAAAAREAGEQVERIRDTSMATASSAQAMGGATMQLSLRIQEVGERARLARAAVQQSVEGLDEAGQGLGAAAIRARNAGDDVAAIHSLVADISAAMLAASREAGNGTVADARSALAFGQFSARAGSAAARISEELAALQELVADSSGVLDSSRQALNSARREAGEISLAVAEQGAVTREIASGISGAATAIAQLGEAVEHLRASLAGAQGATEDFVAIAHRVVDDARQIDDGVRSFMRDAAA